MIMMMLVARHASAITMQAMSSHGVSGDCQVIWRSVMPRPMRIELSQPVCVKMLTHTMPAASSLMPSGRA
jgi:hypothetical protein